MNQSKISTRYAKALFETALQQQAQDTIRDDMTQLYNACFDPKLRYLLENPVIKGGEKRKILQNVFKSSFNKISLSLIDLVSQNKREIYLQIIALNYLTLYKKHKGIKSAVLTTATKIDDKIRTKISELIATQMNTKVEMQERIEPEMIGGFVLRVEDNQIDASIANKLAQIKRELLNTTFERKI